MEERSFGTQTKCAGEGVALVKTLEHKIGIKHPAYVRTDTNGSGSAKHKAY
ncbi:MAG: hypothetical protein ABJN96_16430 [Marinomonas sp.]|uniref:hypothetical protein n=1 Tax=Marinomonas sp. GJ51-6 TaxID=2992802 RepID=UPI0029345210|nr:hypothetical protein [Marinomonas sp. GJ51-6]WOD06229.1 hypothetical protein ONZ50_10835 [Marinomonas sp. GJ51-6]